MRRKISLAAIVVILLLACAGLAAGAAGDSGIVDQNGCKHVGTPQPGKKVIWSGGCVNGFAKGSGTQVWFKDGVETSRYVGPVLAGARHGKGVVTWKSGDRYEGDFVDDKRTGKGIYIWKSGDRYEGDFVDDKRTGKGIYTWKNGNRYEGTFVNGKRTGGVYGKAAPEPVPAQQSTALHIDNKNVPPSQEVKGTETMVCNTKGGRVFTIEHGHIHGGIALPNNNIIFSGSRMGQSKPELWVISTTLEGQILWEHTVPECKAEFNFPFLPSLNRENKVLIPCEDKIVVFNQKGERGQDIRLKSMDDTSKIKIRQVISGDGGFLAVGNLKGEAIIKTNMNGDMVQYEKLGSVYGSEGRLMLAVNKNGEIFAYGQSSRTPRETKAWLVKFSPSLAKLWEVEVSPGESTPRMLVGPSSLLPTKEGGVMITGVVSRIPLTSMARGQALVVNYDATGRVKWEKRFGGETKQTVNALWAVAPQTEDMYVGIGRKVESDGGTGRTWFTRFNQKGLLGESFTPCIWPQSFSNEPEFSEGIGLLSLPNGNLLAFGTYRDKHSRTSKNPNHGYLQASASSWYGTVSTNLEVKLPNKNKGGMLQEQQKPVSPVKGRVLD